MTSTISRQVINDLLPVYLSGEASPDTKALIEQFMQSDPEFAELVKRESRTDFVTSQAPATVDHELRSLRRAKRRLRRKSWLLALAIFFTFISFVISIEDTGITWSWQISPLLTIGLLAVAGLFWYLYSRSLKKFGEPAK